MKGIEILEIQIQTEAQIVSPQPAGEGLKVFMEKREEEELRVPWCWMR